MNNIVPLRAGQMPSVFASRANLPSMNAAAQAGLLPSFGSIGIKGKVWSAKYRGETEAMLDARGIPIPTLEVVIVGVSQAISKRYYATGFNENDEGKAPDCWSSNGTTPDPTSAALQSPTCALCPHNQWGSKITDAGKKAKSCGDARRVAVVPLMDIENSGYGGPMLLSIPPMSLPSLAKYCNDLEKFGAEPFMVGTSLRFDYKMAYPQIEFEALGWLDEAQALAVDALLDDQQIKRMLEAPPAAGEATPAVPNATTAALAGGRPAAGFTKPEADPAQATPPAIDYAKAERDAAAAAKLQIEAEARAKVEAHAKAQAEAQAQAQAQAKPAATTTKPQKKASPFGGGATAQPPAQVQAHTNGAAAPTTPTVVMGAPSDLDAAISDLLAS